MFLSVAAANCRAALWLLRSFQRQGLDRVVLCPGSRSGALATAAGLLAEHSDLQLVTATDERSAAFLALGMATALGRAVAVITTSGSAVANLLPAAVEADRSCQPLLLLTADRPHRLKDCGANQTVNQQDFLRPVSRWLASGPEQGLHAATEAELDALVSQGWHQAHGTPLRAPGPVHLNLPFEEPLHATLVEQQQCWRSLAQMPESVIAPAPQRFEAQQHPQPPGLDPGQPGVVVAGPWRGLAPGLEPYQHAVRIWMQRSGWPLLADPLAALPLDLPGRIAHWDLLLDGLPRDGELQLLRLGPIPASRRLERWLADREGVQVLITEGECRCLDPIGVARQWSGGMAAWLATQPEAENGPFMALHRQDQQVGALLDDRLPCRGPASEPALARALGRLLPKGMPVMLAASSPVRDWMIWSGAGGSDRRCFSFRGASGIDGTLSLAMGLAMAQGPTVLIVGDLALLHDSNGWLHRCADGPPLLVVLIDNAGGGIFQQLPIESGSDQQFDRLFAMPQPVNPLLLAAAHAVPGRQVACLEDLPVALEWAMAQGGPALLRLCTDRCADASLRTSLRLAVEQELF